MGTPANIIGVVELTSTNPSLSTTLNVQGFLVDPTNAVGKWEALLTDKDGNRIANCNGSVTTTTGGPFSHHFSLPMQFRGVNLSTITNVNSVYIYTA